MLLNNISSEKKITRRKFLSRSTILAGSGATNMLLEPKLINGSSSKSKVVVVRHKKAVGPSGKVNQEIIDEMFVKGLTELSGKKSLSDAWQTFVKPDERIGIKINTVGLISLKGTDLNDHVLRVNNSIVSGLRQAGFEDTNLIIWDRHDDELVNAGLTVERGENKVCIMGTNINGRKSGVGYDTRSSKVGKKQTHVSKIITSLTDSIINVSQLKNHLFSGVTLCLKNHYGSIDNPRSFHGKSCTNPGIPEICAIPVIRDKQKLCICDGIIGIHSGGPFWNQKNIFAYGGLVFSKDPVALDRVCLDIINDQRSKLNKKPISLKKAKHIELAAELGLGESKLENIDLKEITL